jgi:HTH-type transcriptional regulator / antitoxin MqsA
MMKVILSFLLKRGDTMKKCPFCKHGILEKKTVKETYTYRGYSAEVEQPGEWCDTCGEGILSGDDLRATESEIRDFQAKVDGLPVFGRISKKLKLITA